MYQLDKINRPLSRLGSVLFLTSVLLCWFGALLSVIALVVLLERSVLESPTNDLYFTWVISLIAPVASVAGMGTPILQVIRALTRPPSEGAKLQWRLFIGIGIASALGVVYGYRKELHAVVVSSFFGMSLQVFNLAAAHKLVLWPSLPKGFVTAMTRGPCEILIKWLMFIPLITVPMSVLVIIAGTVSLDAVLSPVYTVSCLLPYIATFSTFPSDIRVYREWTSTADTSEDKQISFPGIDLNTLKVMQTSNILWFTFGILNWDAAIMISSGASLAAAGCQLACFLSPSYHLTLTITPWTPSLNQPTVHHVILDCAWPFVQDIAFQYTLGAPPIDVEMQTMSSESVRANVKSERVIEPATPPRSSMM